VSDADSLGPFEAVVFDLDGTLVDSRRGIEATLRAALSEIGVDVEPPPLGAQLGLPLDGLIASLGASLDAQQRVAVRAAFVRHYDATGWLDCDLYPGVRAVLTELRGRGIRLFVVTNKRRAPTLAILRHHALASLFEAVYTLDSRMPRFPSKEAMAQACMRDHALRPLTTLVVGDSGEDRFMAQALDTPFAAAAWGYGDAAGPVPESASQDFRVSSGVELGEPILGAIADLPALVLPGRGVEADS